MTTSTINAQGVAILTGDELISKVAELTKVGANKASIVYACGYVRQDGNPNFTEFYTNLMEAKGVKLSPLPTAEEIKAKREARGDGEMTFNISIPVTSYFQVTVTRPANTSVEELWDSITRDELVNGEGEMTWDDIKDAWRSTDADSVYVTDEDGEEIA